MTEKLDNEQDIQADAYARITSWKAISFSVVLLCVMVAPLFWGAPIEYLQTLVEQDVTGSLYIYGLLMILATVVAPITLTPLIPIAGALFGPVTAALVSIISWIIGGGIAFIISRYIGKPIVRYFLSEKSLAWYEKIIPKNGEFWTIVLLRMMLPVDVLSYALGIVSKISFSRYMLATAIGVSPFAFVYTYAGDRASEGNTGQVVLIIALAMVVFVLTAVVYKYIKK